MISKKLLNENLGKPVKLFMKELNLKFTGELYVDMAKNCYVIVDVGTITAGVQHFDLSNIDDTYYDKDGYLVISASDLPLY